MIRGKPMTKSDLKQSEKLNILLVELAKLNNKDVNRLVNNFLYGEDKPPEKEKAATDPARLR